MSENKEWTSRNLRKYDLNLEEIPRMHYQDDRIDDFIANNKPVVITDSNLVKSAQDRWTLDFLENHLGTTGQTVYFSPNHQFKYFDDKKILSRNNSKGVEFTPVIRKTVMKIGEFVKAFKEWKEGDERMYLQQSLTSSVGQPVVEDFLKFNWEYIKSKQLKHNWGKLTSNLLFVSMEGNVTPCHYDEQENFFAEVLGYKRCILFPPDQFDCLYPYPVHHPHDRQSMVDFDNPDCNKFPKFRDLRGIETVLAPGEVLYIPVYWWHHIESLMDCGPTITVNFWYKAAPTSIAYPLKKHQKLSIMRNIEKMLLEVLQNPKEVGPLLKSIVNGRFDD